jgi:hypothetical protein
MAGSFDSIYAGSDILGPDIGIDHDDQQSHDVGKNNKDSTAHAD